MSAAGATPAVGRQVTVHIAAPCIEGAVCQWYVMCGAVLWQNIDRHPVLLGWPAGAEISENGGAPWIRSIYGGLTQPMRYPHERFCVAVN